MVCMLIYDVYVKIMSCMLSYALYFYLYQLKSDTGMTVWVSKGMLLAEWGKLGKHCLKSVQILDTCMDISFFPTVLIGQSLIAWYATTYSELFLETCSDIGHVIMGVLFRILCHLSVIWHVHEFKIIEPSLKAMIQNIYCIIC